MTLDELKLLQVVISISSAYASKHMAINVSDYEHCLYIIEREIKLKTTNYVTGKRNS